MCSIFLSIFGSARSVWSTRVAWSGLFRTSTLCGLFAINGGARRTLDRSPALGELRVDLRVRCGDRPREKWREHGGDTARIFEVEVVAAGEFYDLEIADAGAMLGEA